MCFPISDPPIQDVWYLSERVIFNHHIFCLLTLRIWTRDIILALMADRSCHRLSFGLVSFPKSVDEWLRVALYGRDNWLFLVWPRLICHPNCQLDNDQTQSTLVFTAGWLEFVTNGYMAGNILFRSSFAPVSWQEGGWSCRRRDRPQSILRPWWHYYRDGQHKPDIS